MGKNRRADSYARRGPVREPYDTVLIVCEGAKTEPLYFGGLRTEHRLSSANIAVTNAPGTDPMSIVTYTEQLMAEEDYDRAFSVFDQDSHANFSQAVQHVTNSARGRAGTWQAITSVPSFEVWLMLHFAYSTAPIIRSGNRSPGDMAVRALKVHLPEYEKGANGIYQKLKDQTESAIANSARLLRYNRTVNASNPATDVHILVDYLRKLKG
ncbi:MAG: RloB domain-containing protein [Alphaproteobacteria bacterium]|nr:RloB domain-containing protein [Alphaproteobacteria bacterium]